MGRAKKAIAIKLSDEERDVLERLVRRRKVARGDALRAEIILRAADGMNNCEIADAVGATRQTVRTWRERFAKHRLDGLDDEPRCGAPRKIGDDRIEDIVTRRLETKPEDATHWSTRGLARASGVSARSHSTEEEGGALKPDHAVVLLPPKPNETVQSRWGARFDGLLPTCSTQALGYGVVHRPRHQSKREACDPYSERLAARP